MDNTDYPYVLPKIPCDQRCPNHPDYDKDDPRNRFKHYCSDCYTKLSKMMKPRLQTRTLPHAVILQLQQENARILSGMGMEEIVRQSRGGHSPKSLAPLERQTCFVCKKRLALSTTPCPGCSKYCCSLHKKDMEHNCHAQQHTE